MASSLSVDRALAPPTEVCGIAIKERQKGASESAEARRYRSMKIGLRYDTLVRLLAEICRRAFTWW